jgi:hypothetical protein
VIYSPATTRGKEKVMQKVIITKYNYGLCDDLRDVEQTGKEQSLGEKGRKRPRETKSVNS